MSESGPLAQRLPPPAWPSAAPAWVTRRDGGVSRGPWAGLNLGAHVGDDPAAVAENRRRLGEAVGGQPLWLAQEHGIEVVRATPGLLAGPPPRADAAWSDDPELGCAVLVADCLPVLLASTDGRVVAAAHAGWRGLAGGVLEATVEALQRGAGAEPAELVAWLGPCIGPTRFEVGDDVRQAFLAGPRGVGSTRAFRPGRDHGDGRRRWWADLAALALARLRACGLTRVSVDGRCTAAPDSGLFSYRRDGVSGRFAALVRPVA